MPLAMRTFLLLRARDYRHRRWPGALLIRARVKLRLVVADCRLIIAALYFSICRRYTADFAAAYLAYSAYLLAIAQA